jgi:hypothetical protein
MLPSAQTVTVGSKGEGVETGMENVGQAVGVGCGTAADRDASARTSACIRCQHSAKVPRTVAAVSFGPFLWLDRIIECRLRLRCPGLYLLDRCFIVWLLWAAREDGDDGDDGDGRTDDESTQRRRFGVGCVQ